ncbi:hypothetical protein SAMN04487864_104246 [Succiniclasticum ruminis]|uniref:Uncharacterized protein n=1 Tax=Succiniclasticum ruminis TaxID=40841 RepID=A0A1G6KG21_9FIRM|nr:hypothetical protein [Succiniclasticum ruminis]SDC29904.1 hypothetical protein SAMN04487864_104246 [Succiniclasticum ruminis]
MGVAVMTVLALAILKALVGKIYADCKIGIWLTVITVVVLTGWLVSAIFDKISLIPILFFLR